MMPFLAVIIEFFLHLDTHLTDIVAAYGVQTYFIIFLILFIETGVVIMPFLPGDSLLFALGALTAADVFDLPLLLILCTVAVILGDNMNYWIGHSLGPKVFRSKNARLFNKAHLIEAEQFYEKYGGKTVILARFMPIIRTFSPFVAGIGRMKYKKFLSYSVMGGILWVSLFILGGFMFGNIPVIKNNFEWVILGIVAVSIIPALYAYIKSKFKRLRKNITFR